MKYFAFKKFGKRAIAGPFKSRSEAKPYGKPGHKCRICGGYAGGSSMCYTCILVALSGEMPMNPEPKARAVFVLDFCI